MQGALHKTIFMGCNHLGLSVVTETNIQVYWSQVVIRVVSVHILTSQGRPSPWSVSYRTCTPPQMLTSISHHCYSMILLYKFCFQCLVLDMMRTLVNITPHLAWWFRGTWYVQMITNSPVFSIPWIVCTQAMQYSLEAIKFNISAVIFCNSFFINLSVSLAHHLANKLRLDCDFQ